MIHLQTILCGAYAENAYLLWDDARPDALLIDPGDNLPGLERAVESTGKCLTDILITHGHFDHTLAAAPLKAKYGAKIHIHPCDAHMLTSESAAVMDRSASVLPFTPIEADETYPLDDTFDLNVCGMTFHGLHTPGHSPGGVCLMLPGEKWLFTGDTLFSQGYGRYDFEGGDLHALMRSLRTVLLLDGDLTAYPGHGECDRLGDIAGRWNIKR